MTGTEFEDRSSTPIQFLNHQLGRRRLSDRVWIWRLP
jgi:hypothetical protein